MFRPPVPPAPSGNCPLSTCNLRTVQLEGTYNSHVAQLPESQQATRSVDKDLVVLSALILVERPKSKMTYLFQAVRLINFLLLVVVPILLKTSSFSLNGLLPDQIK